MEENFLCCGIENAEHPVFAGEVPREIDPRTMQEKDVSAWSKKTCVFCGCKTNGGKWRIVHKPQNGRCCPFCATVLDISLLDGNADVAWLPEVPQRNIHLFCLAYFTIDEFIKHMDEARGKGEARKLPDPLQTFCEERKKKWDEGFMGLFKQRVKLFISYEKKRLGIQSEEKLPYETIANIEWLRDFLGGMPRYSYNRRQEILGGIRIIPRNVDYMRKDFFGGDLAILVGLLQGYDKPITAGNGFIAPLKEFEKKMNAYAAQG